jgi:hypothetical protein
MEGMHMTKKQKPSKKATKTSKRTKVLAQPVEEPDTATTSPPAATSLSTPATSQPEGAVEPQQAVATTASAVPATPATPSNPATRSEAAKTNIKEGLRLHQIAGRPTRQQLTQVFGQKGYLLTWPKRTEKFGITPETFQEALAKGVPAVPLTPVAKPAAENPKEKA